MTDEKKPKPKPGPKPRPGKGPSPETLEAFNKVWGARTKPPLAGGWLRVRV